VKITPQRLLDTARVLPIARRAVRELASDRTAFEMIQNLESWGLAHTRAVWSAPRVVRAARDALWVLGKREHSCLPRSFTVFALLKAMGEQPVIVTGVMRVAGELKGHAWVELEGRPIPGSGDESSPSHFRENLRYPTVKSQT
jgi:Transglutaminase-like superfamily